MSHTPSRIAIALLAVTSIAPIASAESGDDASVRRHRMGMLVVQARPSATVRVEQLRHEFWFGAALANDAFDGRMPAADVARYREVFLANFNAAVTENALKWLDMEKESGVVNYATVDAILDWADQEGIPLRGHNIYWGIPKFVQPWVQQLDDGTLRETLRARAHDVATRYRGRFAEYDLNNEMIHGNFYADRLGPGITLDMARWIHERDPDARLYLNDYDILTGARLEQYVNHIRELLAMGVPVAGIGVQGHLHADSFDPAALRHALDELAQFQLPIRVTEFNFPGQRSKFHKDKSLVITPEEEEAAAKALVDYYRICFAHPAVTGILMWGFWEAQNWIPQSSLYRRDWSPTPAATAYRELVYGEWWTTWEGTADANGRCEIPAFYGAHRVTSGDASKVIELRSTAKSATVDLAN